MRLSHRTSRRGYGSKPIACQGAILAAAIVAGAGATYGDPIVFSTTQMTADFNQGGSLYDTYAVNGITSQTAYGWAPGSGHLDSSLPGGEGKGGDIAVFPISPTDIGTNGTDLTFDLYQQYETAFRERIGGFEIEVTTDPSTPSVSSSSVVTGSFTPVTIQSVASSNGITTFAIDSDAINGNYVIAQNANGTTEPTIATASQDIYEITAFTTLTGITGVELITFDTTPNNGVGTATAGEGDGVGLDQNNFVLTQITGTATPAPEPTALGLATLSALLLLGRRRRLGAKTGIENTPVPLMGNS